MATNNLLVNNERKVLYDIQRRVERSGHNLSQSRKFPCEVGLIYPFFCRKTLPSDSFKISTNILIKQLQPLLVPQMVSFTVNTAFYWVDYSLAFPDFEYFLINQKGSQDIELPYLRRPWRPTPDGAYFINFNELLPAVLPNSLSSFLDFSINASNEKVDALPFYSYYRIYRDFYLPVDRISENVYKYWFPGNGKDVLVQGENYSFGNIGLRENLLEYCIPFHDLLPHTVRGDYFVNSYPTPLRGDVPTLSFDSELSDLTADLSGQIKNLSLATVSGYRLDGTSPYYFGSGVDSSEPVQFDSAGKDGGGYTGFLKHGYNYGSGISYQKMTINPDTVQSGSDGNVNTWRAIQLQFDQFRNAFINPQNYSGRISLSNLSNFETQISVTTRQLRLLESLTRKREIDIMMKPRLKNYLQTYFGVNRYKDDSLYQPVFIGSTTQQILINDIEQTVSSSDSPLGRQGATAMSLGSGYVGEYYCRNYGCLMGLMYILPDYDYEPGLPREWSERTPDDFVNPEFTHLSMQPILNKELFVSNDSSWNNEVLGYGGMYDSYRTSSNLVSGLFLDSSMNDIRQFAQVRRFNNDNKPEITESFLRSDLAFDKSVFAVPNMPPFVAQCVTRVEAVRPLPEIAIPRDS